MAASARERLSKSAQLKLARAQSDNTSKTSLLVPLRPPCCRVSFNSRFIASKDDRESEPLRSPSGYTGFCFAVRTDR